MVLSRNKVNAVLLYTAAFLFLIRMLISSIGGTWVLRYANFYSYQPAGNNYGIPTIAIELLFVLLLYNFKFLLRRKDLVWALLCIFAFAFWSIVEYERAGMEVLFGGIPTTPCLLPLFFILGKEESLSKHLKHVSLLLVVGYFSLSLYSAFDFYTSVGWGNRVLSMPAKGSLGMGMVSLWVYLFSDLKEGVGGKERCLKIGLIFLAVICSMLIVSRSWLIQSVLLLAGYLVIAYNLRGRILTMIGLALGIFCLLLFAGPFVVDIMTPLLERVEEDTRSGQFQDFFSQIEAWKLLFGAGMNASYFFGEIEYRYFDNQFIFEAFHYGCFHLVPLLWFLFRTLGVSVGRIKDPGQGRSYWGAKLVVIAFLLAMGGLAVYLRYDWSISTALFLMFAGKHSVLPGTEYISKDMEDDYQEIVGEV